MVDDDRRRHLADDAADRVTPAAERVNAAIDRLLAERRPTSAPADPDEAELLLLAATFKQLRPGASDPRLEFADLLGRRLRQVRRAPRPALSRRRVLTAGAAAAGAMAAGAAGFAVGRLADPRATTPPPSTAGPGAARGDPSRDLTLANGQWVPIARLTDIPPGTVLAFTAGAIMGHVLNEAGTLRALSAICTHMGCLLTWQSSSREFFCPCHGANFGPDGVIRPTPEYPYRPPPLPRLQVKVDDGTVLVWTTSADDAALTRAAPPSRPEPPTNRSPAG